MLSDVKIVWPVIVGCDLYRKPHAVANVLNKRVSRPPIAFPDLMRENKFRVSVDARPQPIISPLCIVVLRKSATVTADVLPLLVHLDSAAWQIAEIRVHVIGKRVPAIRRGSIVTLGFMETRR